MAQHEILGYVRAANEGQTSSPSVNVVVGEPAAHSQNKEPHVHTPICRYIILISTTLFSSAAGLICASVPVKQKGAQNLAYWERRVTHKTEYIFLDHARISQSARPAVEIDHEMTG